MGTIVLFAVMFSLLVLGIPIGISLAFSMFALLAVQPVTTPEFVAQALYSGISSFTLLSLPFFIIAGSIMETGGISKRLVNVANSMVGNVTGGLGMVTVVSCMFFGAISGSAPATVAAIGAIMIPQMIRAGYDKYYATGLVAVAGGLGVIVPPSYPLVIYGVANNVSIGNLFLAGIGPAFVVGGILMLINYIYCRRVGYKGTGERFSLLKTLRALWDAKLAMLMPIIILGGIYGGVFTATEASVVSTVYGIIVGKYVYKEITWKKIWGMYRDNIPFLGGMMFTFAPAASMGAIFACLGVPEMVKNFFFGISQNIYVILFLIFIMLIIAGMFVQTTPIMVILAPIFLNVVEPLGVSPIHFGIIMTLGLAIGFVTPPVAANLFVATSMTGLSVTTIARRAMPFIMGLFLSLIIVGYIPGISIGLLRLMGIPA